MGFLTNLFGQNDSHNKYESHWAFYLLNVNDKIASITTDLNLKDIAPIKEQEILFDISIEMKNPKDNGTSSSDEAKTLWEIENRILELLDEKKASYTFAGRLTTDGYRTFLLYGNNKKQIESFINSAMTTYPTYSYEVKTTTDESWKEYFDFLYPLPIQLQSIQNREVVEVLEQSGDSLTKEREVFHWIYFKNKNELNEFEQFTKELGFKTLKKEKTEATEDYIYVLKISRVDKVGFRDIDDYTLKLWEKAKELNGDYDGWETSVEK